MSDQKLFNPARLPTRDADGMTYHPDLGEDRFQHDVHEEYLDLEKFRAVGFETSSVSFEYDATGKLMDHFSDTGEADCAAWTPSYPKGDGWQLIAIYDTEDGPLALYVRPLTSAITAGIDL
jgi:hypothetical protein